MGLIKTIAAIGYQQAKNLGKVALGKPLIMPSFSSMTLDKDDVLLAEQWLKRPKDWYKNTEIVAHYQTEFAKWNGSKYAFSFMGGRVALSACIYALGLQSDDEVILPGYTCVVVPNAFHYAGVRVIYSDIELDTYGLDVTQVEKKITSKTKAILLHHLYGLVCRDYKEIILLARKYNLKVIEDCAQSAGAEFEGHKVGNLGDVAIYSSEKTKVFNTIQGGLAVTNDDDLRIRLEEYHNQASYPSEDCIDKQLHTVFLKYFQFKHPQRWWRKDLIYLQYGAKHLNSIAPEEEQGIRPVHYGQKMPVPIAALGLNQLHKVDKYNLCRREAAQFWAGWCEQNDYKKPLVVPTSTPVYLRYPVLVEPEKKQDTSWAIKSLRTNVGVWFSSNIHPTTRLVEECPNADKAVRQCINFPCLLG